MSGPRQISAALVLGLPQQSCLSLTSREFDEMSVHGAVNRRRRLG